MRIARQFIMLILCCLPCHPMWAQGEGKASLEVSRDGGTYIVRFAIGELSTPSVGSGMLTLEADGLYTCAPHEGLPALPAASQLLMLPKGSSLTVGKVALDVIETVLDQPLMPYAGPAAKDRPAPTAVPDKKVYGSDVAYRAGAPIEVENLGVMGDQQVFRIMVNPAEYRPLSGRLTIATHISATISANIKEALAEIEGLPERFLIVSRPEFREGLQPFVDWKRREGYEVIELYADTHQRDVVKEMIRPYFRHINPLNPMPKYLLIVGDAAQIQAFVGTSNPADLEQHITDLYYAEFTGDYLPEAIVGRWPVNDTAELRAVMEKTLRYEQFADIDTLQLKRMLLVAGAENSSPAPITTNGQVNYLKHEIKLSHPHLDTLCYHNPASGNQRQEILHNMGQGTGLVNFTAHCTVGGWSNPSVSFNAIDTLPLTQPTLYVNNCCKSNSFTGTCFGEQLIRKPVGGAIGVIGATNSTLWSEDYYWAVGPKLPLSVNPVFDMAAPGAFDRWIGRLATVNTQGGLLQAGNLAVTASVSSQAHFYWEIYCLFGDPSLRPYIGAPQEVWLSVPDTLTAGDTEVRINGTLGSTVSAVQGGKLLATKQMDDTWSTTLTFSQPLDTLPVEFTATGPQMIPAYATSHTRRPQGKAVTFRDIVVTDTAIHLQVVSIGHEDIDSLTVEWLPVDTDSPYASALTARQQLSLDSLAVGAERGISLPIEVQVYGQMWSGELTATGAAAPTVMLSHWIEESVPSMTFHLARPDNSQARRIDPNQNYQMHWDIEGIVDSASASITTLPDGNRTDASSEWTAFSTDDSVSHLRFDGYWQHGNLHNRVTAWMVAGDRMDSFEDGFNSYPWYMQGVRPWTIDSTVCHDGRYSIRSGNITHSQQSTLQLDVWLPDPDSISFWAKISSEARYDKLTFSVDGNKRMELYGEMGWAQYKYRIGAGRHTLNWNYIKDHADSDGSDCAWLDDMRLPLALWDSAYGWFGSTQIGISAPVHTETPVVVAYPNPADQHVMLFADEPTTVTIYDLTGRAVSSINLEGDSRQRLATATWPEGVYLIRIHASSTVSHHKLIIKH